MPCKPFANLFQVAKRGRQLRQKDVEIRKTPGNRGARLQCPIACRTGCAPWIQTGLARTPVLRKDLALGLHRIRRKRAWGDGSAWRKRGRARGLDGDWRTTGSPPVGTVLLQSHLPTQSALKEREGHIARTGGAEGLYDAFESTQAPNEHEHVARRRGSGAGAVRRS